MTSRQKEIVDMLKQCNWCKNEAARQLGVTAKTIRDSLKSAGIVQNSKGKADIDETDDPAVSIEGITPDEHDPDPETIWNRLIEQQKETEQYVQKRYTQSITVNEDKPVAIAFPSDLHLGSNYCDYKQIKEDADLISNTDGMYAIACGDYWDNWLGRLEFIQREQKCDFDSELVLVEDWFARIGDSLLAVIAGNHDNRTRRMAGIDYVKKILGGTQLLYDSDEVCFTLNTAGGSKRIKARHKWLGSSMYNQTHGQERDARFGDTTWDIAIGAHQHTGTVFRDFVHDGRLRLAVLIGTYAFEDRYRLELGLAKNVPGTGALVFHEDGTIETKRDLQTTAKYLKWLRE